MNVEKPEMNRSFSILTELNVTLAEVEKSISPTSIFAYNFP